MRDGHDIAVADRKESNGGPVDAVDVEPAFDVGEDSGAAEQIHDEEQGLGHESSLGEIEGHAEVGIVVIPVGTPGGDYKEGGEDEVDPAGYAGIVERRGECIVGRRLDVMNDADCHDEHDERDIPANDRDWLGYVEVKTMGHAHEEGEISKNCYGQGDGFDRYEPGIIDINFIWKFVI